MSFIDSTNLENIISITPLMTFFKEQFKSVVLNDLDMEILRNTELNISLDIEDFLASVK